VRNLLVFSIHPRARSPCRQHDTRLPARTLIGDVSLSPSLSLSPCLCFCLCSTHRVENRITREWWIVWSVLARSELSGIERPYLRDRIKIWLLTRTIVEENSIVNMVISFFLTRGVFFSFLRNVVRSVLQWIGPDLSSWENCNWSKWSKMDHFNYVRCVFSPLCSTIRIFYIKDDICCWWRPYLRKRERRKLSSTNDGLISNYSCKQISGISIKLYIFEIIDGFVDLCCNTRAWMQMERLFFDRFSEWFVEFIWTLRDVHPRCRTRHDKSYEVIISVPDDVMQEFAFGDLPLDLTALCLN